jgi:hypothetical protein
MEELLGRVVTIGCYESVEVFLYGFEMRLAVPEGVVSIEGYDSDWQCGHIPLMM